MDVRTGFRIKQIRIQVLASTGTSRVDLKLCFFPQVFFF